MAASKRLLALFLISELVYSQSHLQYFRQWVHTHVLLKPYFIGSRLLKYHGVIIPCHGHPLLPYLTHSPPKPLARCFRQGYLYPRLREGRVTGLFSVHRQPDVRKLVCFSMTYDEVQIIERRSVGNIYFEARLEI